ncbi:hypothetical protein CKAH01_07610 [Colletotrichum kahawae]|uniref:Uncharacterized protein n=1 Tax=Colletotrichum kahawae TaxID=34407 RepID=A0AAE0D197_COLKA|nr:hypothetical protein CKAH01_07610 [Colletotrichum kahawae]
MARFTECPPEVIVEICRQLVLPLQTEQHACDLSADVSMDNSLSCRIALARLMRTCRKLHDAAGCSSRPELVRHADLHHNLYESSSDDINWSKEQEDMTEGPWINRLAGVLGMRFPDGWNMCRVGMQFDHVLEHIGQVFLAYLPTLKSLDVKLCYNWKFDLLQQWTEGRPSDLLPNLRHLKIQMRSAKARKCKAHQIILGGAPFLATLEIYNSLSYTIPSGFQLVNLQNLKLINCLMDLRSMTEVLTATPNITYFEYRGLPPGTETSKKPLLGPQMLCNLLRNEYDLAASQASGTTKLDLPNLHRQLRTLKIDLHSTRFPFAWDDSETITSLRDFSKLRNLSIDTHSFTSRTGNRSHLIMNNIGKMIPPCLETLEISHIGEFLLEELVQVGLREIVDLGREGQLRKLRRVSLTDCIVHRHRPTQQKALHDLQEMFDISGAPSIYFNGKAL